MSFSHQPPPGPQGTAPAPISDERRRLLHAPRGPLNFEELLLVERAHAAELQRNSERLAELVGRMQMPAQVEPVGPLTSASRQATSRNRWELPTLSIGVVNLDPALSAAFSTWGSPDQIDAMPIRPRSLVVLPVSAGEVELFSANAPAPPAGHYLLLLRFFSVQPAFVGELG